MNKGLLKRAQIPYLWFFPLLIMSFFGVLWIINAAFQGRNVVPLASSTSQEPQNSKTQENPGVQAPQLNSGTHSVTQAAVKYGVFSSLKRINQVATFLTANNENGVFVFAPNNPPDEHLLTTSFELIRPDSTTMYATASFFPNSDAVYDTVEYVKMSCEEVEKKVFGGLKRVGILKKNIIMLDGGSVKVFLMPAGSGCVVTKKEVL